jgi:hypothetical protein
MIMIAVAHSIWMIKLDIAKIICMIKVTIEKSMRMDKFDNNNKSMKLIKLAAHKKIFKLLLQISMLKHSIAKIIINAKMSTYI